MGAIAEGKSPWAQHKALHALAQHRLRDRAHEPLVRVSIGNDAAHTYGGHGLLPDKKRGLGHTARKGQSKMTDRRTRGVDRSEGDGNQILQSDERRGRGTPSHEWACHSLDNEADRPADLQAMQLCGHTGFAMLPCLASGVNVGSLRSAATVNTNHKPK